MTFLVFLSNRKIVSLTIILHALITAPAFGGDMQQEINHLLQFVKHTVCQYERNGQLHSGKEAVEHIKKKYYYFKDDIDSTEKFIELSATKSTLSGKFYFVHCPNRPPLKSQDWLLEELNHYRKEVGS
ncbi:MAG: DUF5329 family protein [Nitrospirota bacterium]|nr:MAG: DUF5329 family protein [Nitrospirota bacterium]